MSDPLERRRVTQQDIADAEGTEQAKLFLSSWLKHCIGVFDETGTTVTFHEPTQLGAFASLDLQTGSFAEIGSREARLRTNLDQEAVDLLKAVWLRRAADDQITDDQKAA